MKWDRARLDALAERAHAWLAASFGDRMVTLDMHLMGYMDGREVL